MHPLEPRPWVPPRPGGSRGHFEGCCCPPLPPPWEARVRNVRSCVLVREGLLQAGEPPLTHRPVPFRLPANDKQRSLLLHEIQVLLAKNVFAQVPVSQLGHASFYCSMFLVPKPNGTYRPILYVWNLNVYIDCPHFKMETIQSVRASMRPSDWTFSVDLKDA